MGVFRRTKRPSRRKISSQPRYDHFDTSPCIFNVNRAFRKMQEKHARTILNCEIWTPEKPYITVISGGWIDQSGFPFRVLHLRPLGQHSVYVIPHFFQKLLERTDGKNNKIFNFRTGENPVFMGFFSGANGQLFKKFRVRSDMSTSIRFRIFWPA